MDTTNWRTIKEAAQDSGVSERTIERKIEKQLITVAKRQEPGKKAVIVLPPDEVAKLSATPLRPTVQPPTIPVKPSARQPDMRALLKALEQLRVPVIQKLYLNEQETALYLGFSKAEVVRLLDEGSIPSFRLKDRQRRVARKDVESYTPTPRQLTGLRHVGVTQVEANGHAE